MIRTVDSVVRERDALRRQLAEVTAERDALLEQLEHAKAQARGIVQRLDATLGEIVERMIERGVERASLEAASSVECGATHHDRDTRGL